MLKACSARLQHTADCCMGTCFDWEVILLLWWPSAQKLPNDWMMIFFFLVHQFIIDRLMKLQYSFIESAHGRGTQLREQHWTSECETSHTEQLLLFVYLPKMFIYPSKEMQWVSPFVFLIFPCRPFFSFYLIKKTCWHYLQKVMIISFSSWTLKHFSCLWWQKSPILFPVTKALFTRCLTTGSF